MKKAKKMKPAKKMQPVSSDAIGPDPSEYSESDQELAERVWGKVAPLLADEPEVVLEYVQIQIRDQLRECYTYWDG